MKREKGSDDGAESRVENGGRVQPRAGSSALENSKAKELRENRAFRAVETLEGRAERS